MARPSEANIATILAAIGGADLVRFDTAVDAVSSPLVLPGGDTVQAFDSLSPRAGSVSTPATALLADFAGATTEEVRPFIAPDGSIAPQYGGQASPADGFVGGVATKHPLGSVATRNWTAYLVIGQTHSWIRPPDNTSPGLNGNWTIWIQDDGNDSSRVRLTSMSGNRMFADSFGAFGGQNGEISGMPVLLSWPDYHVIAIRVDAAGQLRVYVDGVHRATYAPTIADNVAAARSLHFGRAATGFVGPSQAKLMHLVWRSAVDDDATIATNSAALLSGQPDKTDNTRRLFTVKVDSKGSGFRARYGETAAALAAQSLGARVAILGRASAVIAGAPLAGAGTAQSTGVLSLPSSGGIDSCDLDLGYAAVWSEYTATSGVYDCDEAGVNSIQRAGAFDAAATLSSLAGFNGTLEALPEAPSTVRRVALELPRHLVFPDASENQLEEDEWNAAVLASSHFDAVARTRDPVVITIGDNEFVAPGADQIHPNRDEHVAMGAAYVAAILQIETPAVLDEQTGADRMNLRLRSGKRAVAMSVEIDLNGALYATRSIGELIESADGDAWLYESPLSVSEQPGVGTQPIDGGYEVRWTLTDAQGIQSTTTTTFTVPERGLGAGELRGRS